MDAIILWQVSLAFNIICQPISVWPLMGISSGVLTCSTNFSYWIVMGVVGSWRVWVKHVDVTVQTGGWCCLNVCLWWLWRARLQVMGLHGYVQSGRDSLCLHWGSPDSRVNVWDLWFWRGGTCGCRVKIIGDQLDMRCVVCMVPTVYVTRLMEMELFVARMCAVVLEGFARKWNWNWKNLPVRENGILSLMHPSRHCAVHPGRVWCTHISRLGGFLLSIAPLKDVVSVLCDRHSLITER